MFLLYINELGADYKGQKQYEFIFGKNKDIQVDEWYNIPASGISTPPEVSDIDLIGLLKHSDLQLELIQNSDYFGVIDAVTDVIALGWERYDEEEHSERARLSFRYGEELYIVTEKLEEHGLRLINEEVKYKL